MYDICSVCDFRGGRFNTVTVDIKKMRFEDLGAVVELENELFSPPWSYNSFVKELNSELRSCLVAVDKGKVIGYAIGAMFYDEVHIMSIGVTTNYQRSSVATKLMVELLNYAYYSNSNRVLLEVRASNKPAIALYTKFGFAPVGVRKKYYTHPVEDALVLIAEGINDNDYKLRFESIKDKLRVN